MVHGAWPRTENMRQVLSWYTALRLSVGSVNFWTLPDSPVRMLWSARSVVE